MIGLLVGCHDSGAYKHPIYILLLLLLLLLSLFFLLLLLLSRHCNCRQELTSVVFGTLSSRVCGGGKRKSRTTMKTVVITRRFIDMLYDYVQHSHKDKFVSFVLEDSGGRIHGTRSFRQDMRLENEAPYFRRRRSIRSELRS